MTFFVIFLTSRYFDKGAHTTALLLCQFGSGSQKKKKKKKLAL